MPLPGNATVAHCPKCGKQLRFVLADNQAQIRCPVCKNVFSYVTAKRPIIEKYCPFQGCGWPATKGDYCDMHASKEVRNRLKAEHKKLVAEGEAKEARIKQRLANEPKSPVSQPKASSEKTDLGIKFTQDGEDVKPVTLRVLKEQYELLAEVGRGGFGAVYKARDVHLGQFVAVKELILEDPAPLKEEAKVLSELRHKNIVGFRQLFPDQQRWYMVMDYVEGGNLAKLISRSTLYEGGGDIALKRMLLIAQHAAEGLNCAHDRGIIHQDMKPANVMVDLKGVAKVSDFGLAKARPQGVGYVPAGGTQSIMVSANGMTPAYCSPEQANGQRLTSKTDTWSWGLSVVEMFAGEVTWRSGSAAREALQRCVATQAKRKDIPPLPQQLTNLLERCFQDEPTARPDMDDIAASLVGIQGGGGGNWFKRFLK